MRECIAQRRRVRGRALYIALDLASRTIWPRWRSCSRSRIRDRQDAGVPAFARCYVPCPVLEARNPSYPSWAAAGYLTITPGKETDFGRIESDILDLCKRYKVLSVAYDPWAATQLTQRLSAERVPVIEFRANTQNFSEPTKELDAAMRAHRPAHDRNPVLEWCIGNWSAATTQGPMSILGRPGRNRRSTRPSRSSWQSPAAWRQAGAFGLREPRGDIYRLA